ncbi:MAG: sucrose phosphorylase [Bacteroidota bacterium]
MQNKVQLITYVDRLGGAGISYLNELVKGPFKDLFGGVHLLPFFDPIDGQDAGFDPIDHTQIDPRLGDWPNVLELGKTVDIMADLIVNHISAKSGQFLDFMKKGEVSKYCDLFLTKEKVFPGGGSEEEISQIYRPRPGLPFTKFQFADGTIKTLWTTFTANQIDMDVASKAGMAYLERILDTFQKAGISMIRLDAAGYAVKKRGTSCFMIEETFDFISQLANKAKKRGMEVLVEIHSFYRTQIQIAERVDYVYDFALPVLVLDTLFNKDATHLGKWLAIASRNVITVLDTHDGIGIVDVASESGRPGLIPDPILDGIVEKIHKNSGGTSLKATGAAASNLDLYQVNCTYFEALGKNKKAYLIARAIQFFAPGIPQVYYVGLFAEGNDMVLLGKTNVGRDINRHYFTKDEILKQTKSDWFSAFTELIHFRNAHPAFKGKFHLIEAKKGILKLKWTHRDHWAQLSIDLVVLEGSITFSKDTGQGTLALSKF